jgi:hypothetical protein
VSVRQTFFFDNVRTCISNVHLMIRGFDPFSRAAALAGVATSIAVAAGTVSAQQRPPLRELGPMIFTSEALGALSGMRPLPGGRVLVNDPAKRQVLLLDSSLKVIGIVADTTRATQNSYGTRGGGLLAYRGDSSLLIDPASFSMLVIDPAGKVSHVIAAPRPEALRALIGGPSGSSGFDSRGRLVYQNVFPNFGNRPVSAGQSLQLPDTAPIVRFDLATRRLDTAAFTKVYATATRLIVLHGEDGSQLSPVIDPLPLVDDWTMLPDGVIAILRKDYHVDFIEADGSKSSGGKIPFYWQHLSDSAKVALIESARVATEKLSASEVPAGYLPLGVNIGLTGPSGEVGSIQVGGGASRRKLTPPPVSFVAPSELPDYKPAFAARAMHADAEGNLWVRIIPTKATTETAGRPEYDVLDRTGKLVDCVIIPKGTTIVGFGPGGAVYLGLRDTAGVHLVRARER